MLLKHDDRVTQLDVPLIIASAEEVSDICEMFKAMRGDGGHVIHLEHSARGINWDSESIAFVEFVERLESVVENTDLLLLYELKGRDLYSARDAVELFQRVFYRHCNIRYLRLVLSP
jgi:hypothetical protein